MTKKSNQLKIEQPKLFPSDLNELIQPEIHSHDFFELGLVQDCVFKGLAAHKATFDKFLFKHVTFDQVSLTGVELTDVVFEKCDLSNIDFSDAVIHRTKFIDCKIIGFNAAGATLRNIEMNHCLADYATFRFSNARQLAIRDSALNKSDFHQCKWQKIEFTRCQIDQSQWSGTKLDGIDLSDCEFDGLGVAVEDLRGCIISRQQAYVFAKLFGLQIADD